MRAADAKAANKLSALASNSFGPCRARGYDSKSEDDGSSSSSEPRSMMINHHLRSFCHFRIPECKSVVGRMPRPLGMLEAPRTAENSRKDTVSCCFLCFPEPF